MLAIKLGSKGTDVALIQRELNLQPDGIFGPLTKEAIIEFQKANGLTADGIVGIKTWEKLGIGKVNTRIINEIIVHCSATPEDKDYTVSDIKKWHIARGFTDIGYHYIIYKDGSIHEGRNIAISGAHCKGHNTHSIGVCYIGGCEKDGKTPKDTRTKEQKESLIRLLKKLKVQYPKAIIHSHKDFVNKACPSFDATNEYKSL